MPASVRRPGRSGRMQAWPRSSSRLVAGVDSSTQSCKVVVCDAETGEVVRQGRAPHPDGTEVHPREWWAAYEAATADGLLDGVRAIAVGGQQHGMVTLDEADEVVRPALLWNDTRSAQDASDLTEEFGGAQRWADEVGVVPVASFTITSSRWLRRAEPESLERTRTCVLPHDWLTGQILKQGNGFDGWTTDRGDASGTGYWSAGSGHYLPEAHRPRDRPFARGASRPRAHRGCRAHRVRHGARPGHR